MTEEAFQDQYYGKHTSREAFVKEYFCDTHDMIPEYLGDFIDWEAMANRWQQDGWTFHSPTHGQVFVFNL
jgi:antirestriction protein